MDQTLTLLRYVWTFPTTAIGLLFVPLALISGGGVQYVHGVIEIYGGVVAGFLEHGTLLPNGAIAMTLGHVVLGQTQSALDLTREHERVHVRQAERWGPLFIPAYLTAGAWTALCGGRAYRDNPFEREAFAVSSPRKSHPFDP